MSATLSSDVLQDDIAVAIARAIAAANKRARELNIDVMQSIIMNSIPSAYGSNLQRFSCNIQGCYPLPPSVKPLTLKQSYVRLPKQSMAFQTPRPKLT